MVIQALFGLVYSVIIQALFGLVYSVLIQALLGLVYSVVIQALFGLEYSGIQALFGLEYSGIQALLGLVYSVYKFNSNSSSTHAQNPLLIQIRTICALDKNKRRERLVVIMKMSDRLSRMEI